MIYLELFLGFLRVGCFSFGGGYGAIALIRDVVLSHGWLTEERLAYMIGVSESTPGPIMVNMATYVGSSQAGLPGAALATFAVVLPAFCIILLILILMKNLMKNPCVQAVLGGMQPCVIGIILATGAYMTAEACFAQETVDIRAAIVALILGVLAARGEKLTGRKLSPIALIMISAALGAVLYGI